MQFIRTKRARFSIKTFVLPDACTGYIWNSVIYTRGDTRINPDSDFTYNATNFVMSLAEDTLDEGRCISVDNWYSSIELLDELGKRSTDVIGTAWKDSKALPKDVVKSKLNKGETKTAYSTQYNAMCMQWKDKRDVRMLSSSIPDENVSVIQRAKEVTVPLVVNIDSNMMDGVDRSDQMMNSYPVERKRLKKWYKKCGFILSILVYLMLIYYIKGKVVN